MNTGIRLLVLLALSFFAPACFDPITLDLPPSEEQKMVIEGYVNQGAAHLDVFFQAGINVALSERGTSIQRIPVAQAYLIYNGIPFPEYALANGQTTRLPLQPFLDRAGREEDPTFSLYIILPDGRAYESAPETLSPVPKTVAIDIDLYQKLARNRYGYIEEGDFLEIKVTTPLRVETREKSFLKWDLAGVYRFIEKPPPPDNPFINQHTCYVDHKLGRNEILLFNGRTTTEETLTRYPVLKDIPTDHYFALGYYLTIYQQSLSAGAYRYWDQLRQNSSLGGGLFEPAPGSVQGNIKNVNNPDEPILGYFYVSQTDTIRRLIRPEEADYPRAFCYIQGNEETINCIDCTTRPGSTLKKPDYWIE